MRVVLYTETLRLGGTPKHVSEHAISLKNYGFDVTVLSSGGFEHYFYELQRGGINVRVNVSFLSLALNLYRIKPHIFHTFSYGARIRDVLIGRIFTRQIYRSNRNSGHWYSGRLIERIKIRLRSKLVKKYFVNSALAKEFVLNYELIEQNKVVLVVNGIVDKSSLWPYTRKDDLGVSAEFMFVSVERLRPLKNTKTSILIIDQLNKLGVDCGLIIVGYGETFKELNDLVDSLSLRNKVQFIGYNLYPYSFMRVADAFISSSFSEGLSNSLVEALMMSLPIFISKGNGKECIRQSWNGLSFNEKDTPERIALHIAPLIKKSILSKYSENSRKLYNEKFSIQVQVSKYIDEYEI